MLDKPASQAAAARRSQALAALHTIGLDISSQLEMGELLRGIIRHAVDLLGGDAGGTIYMYEPTEDLLRVVEGTGYSAQHVGRTMKPGEGLAGRAFENNRAMAVDDYRGWEGRSPAYAGEDIRAVLSVPLRWQDQVIGVLNVVSSREGRVFDEDDVWLAELFAAQVAIAISNARLYEESRLMQERFRDIALSTSDWLWEIDRAGRMVYCSDRITDVLGYRPEEASGKSIFDLVHPDDLERLAATINQLSVDGETTIIFGGTFYHKSGREVILEAIGSPLLDASGRVVGYRGTARDVTQRREAAQREQIAYEIGQQLITFLSLDELMDSIVRRIREAFEYYHVHVFLFDGEEEELVVKACSSEAGTTSESAIPLEAKPSLVARAARSLRPVVSHDVRADSSYLPNVLLPDTRSEAACPLFRGERLLGVLDVQSAEVAHFSEAEVRTLENLAAQISIAVENARLYRALEQQAEHLEELVAERTDEIARERERLTAIVENAGEGIIFTTLLGVIEYANPAWAHLTGHHLDDVIGASAPDLLGLTPEEQREISRTVIKGDAWKGEFHPRRPDGSGYVVDVTVAPVTDADGRVAYLVSVMRDVTAQKEVERMRTRFVANVSHELRTPIANLKLYYTLLSTGPEEKRRFYLDTMAGQIGRLERLVEDLLDLSRIDRGVLTMNPEKLNPNGLVEELVRAHSPRAEERGLSLSTDLTPDLPEIVADRERIMQVLVNLLANAINYTSAGDRLGIRTWLDEESVVPRVALCVWDTGPGIAPEDLPFIFNRFFRAQTAKDSGVPGTGLGLSIVKENVTLHHGTIKVNSTLGEGTQFTVYLPIDLPPAS
jgi:PAS domain S-box-containing protein